jgi:bleomycin hydrolase
MKKSICLSSISLVFILFASALTAQTKTNKKGSNYTFTIEKEVGTTDVKSQDNTGTCWSFSGMSFLESELERMGKGKVNLSQMFTVRNAYSMKTDRFIRMGGKNNFGAGGAFHDVTIVLREYGVAPASQYTGFVYGQNKHNHSELDAVLNGMVSALVKLPEGKLTPVWHSAVDGVLDAYLGKVPEKFDIGGKKMSSMEYAKSLGLNADDYVEITSFTHHPFYSRFVLEVADNWASDLVYNVPLNEFEQIVDEALKNNYSVAWASDVSEKGFSFKNGLALVPENDIEDMTKEEKDSIFVNPVKQKVITQEMRQKGFDEMTTTDDHGMHIVGIAKDQKGTKYYIVKNSWGTKNNECEGFFYCSSAFMLYKTTCLMVHKNAVPNAIAAKLGIKK